LGVVSSQELTAFIVRRLLALVGVLLIVSFVTFVFIYAAPGSPEAALVGQERATPELVQTLRSRYHLDDPFLVQYVSYIKDAAQLDLGTSLRTGQDVLPAIVERCGVTVPLALMAILISMTAGVLLGTLAALRRQTIVDRAAVGISIVGVSTPAFASGIVLLYVFGVLLNWFPVFGDGRGFADRFSHLVLPAVALALTGMASILRMTRAAMIRVLDQDYVTFARARGLSAGRVLVSHALRNALVSIITAGGALFGLMLAGSVVIEATFSLNGVGLYLVEAANRQDIPAVQGVTLVVAVLVVLVNLVIDLLYVVIDPRIRFGAAAA
jgi:peptide/nickel transport system permease protein